MLGVKLTGEIWNVPKKLLRNNKGKFIAQYKFNKNNKKKCSICNEFKGPEKFKFIKAKNLYESRCRDCFNYIRKTKYRKNEEQINKEKEYREKNKQKLYELKKKWKNENREKDRLTTNNRAKIRRKTDPEFKIRSNLSRRINHALTNQFSGKKTQKAEKTMELIGCTVPYLIRHLEKMFKKGMNWQNYGEWEIDHITPVDWFVKNFDFKNAEVQKQCFNFKNLQPLWKLDNVKKSNKIKK